LRGVDIYAARIHGIAKDVDKPNHEAEPGLSFFDITNGISFFRNGDWTGDLTNPNTAKETFSIGTYGFITNLTALQRALTFIEVLSPNDTNTDLVFRTTGL